MGITIAPLTSAVMGSVEPRHAGVASGINNAVSRAAGLLAVAALGVVLRARFDSALDLELAPLALSPRVAAVVDAQRGRLGGAEFPADLDPALRRALGEAFDRAYAAGFRALMLTCAVLAALGALAAFAIIEPSRGAPRRGVTRR
jgi:hypothetical protein